MKTIFAILISTAPDSRGSFGLAYHDKAAPIIPTVLPADTQQTPHSFKRNTAASWNNITVQWQRLPQYSLRLGRRNTLQIPCAGVKNRRRTAADGLPLGPIGSTPKGAAKLSSCTPSTPSALDRFRKPPTTKTYNYGKNNSQVYWFCSWP